MRLDHIHILTVMQHVNKQGSAQQLCVASVVYGVISLPDDFKKLSKKVKTEKN